MNPKAISDGKPRRHHDADGHPPWCARGHHCTARRITGGEHASIPEVWDTRHGRVVGTRYRNDTGRDRVEIRIVVRLADDDSTAETQCRQVIASIALVVEQRFAPVAGRAHPITYV